MPQSQQKENVMKYKLVYTSLILFIYIIGKNIPLYGIDISAYSYKSANAEEVMMQMISGDAYRTSVLALGLFPFMISGILVQIVMALKNRFSKTRVSPKALSRASAALTFVIAILQAFVQVTQLKFAVPENMLFYAKLMVVLEMVTGVMVILWLSNRNGKYGVGGRMVLALVNIMERIVITVIEHDMQRLTIPLLVSMVVMVIMLVMENTEKRIPVQRVSIHNVYADKNYLAVKLNPVGVMPVMFSTAVFMLPSLIVSMLGYLFPHHAGISWWQENLVLTAPLGICVYIICEYLLTISFSILMINPKDITEQFLKSGDCIVNLHAGHDTRRYLRRTIWRISFFSATVMGACIAIPLILQMQGHIDSTLVMLPSSVMMLTGFWCNIYRELQAIHKYDAYQPLF